MVYAIIRELPYLAITAVVVSVGWHFVVKYLQDNGGYNWIYPANALAVLIIFASAIPLIKVLATRTTRSALETYIDVQWWGSSLFLSGVTICIFVWLGLAVWSALHPRY